MSRKKEVREEGTMVTLVRKYTSGATMAIAADQLARFPETLERTDPRPRDWKVRVLGKVITLGNRNDDPHGKHTLTIQVRVDGTPRGIKGWTEACEAKYNQKVWRPDSELTAKLYRERIANGKTASKKTPAKGDKTAS